MPPRSALDLAPAEVRAALDQELVRRGFSGYEELVEMLARHGVATSAPALSRYSARLRERVSKIQTRVQESVELSNALGDDPHALSRATIIKAQMALDDFIENLSPEAAEDGGGIDPKSLGAMSRAARDLAAAFRDHEKWRAALEAEQRRKLDALEAEARGGKGTLDLDTLAKVREVYGW